MRARGTTVTLLRMPSPHRETAKWHDRNRMKSQDEAIREITRRLVDYYHPVKIYLFGSTARGEAGSDSDLDFCVVVPDETPNKKLSVRSAWEAVQGVGYANDVIPLRLTDFEQRAADVRASLPATIVREGRLLYESQRR